MPTILSTLGKEYSQFLKSNGIETENDCFEVVSQPIYDLEFIDPGRSEHDFFLIPRGASMVDYKEGESRGFIEKPLAYTNMDLPSQIPSPKMQVVTGIEASIAEYVGFTVIPEALDWAARASVILLKGCKDYLRIPLFTILEKEEQLDIPIVLMARQIFKVSIRCDYPIKTVFPVRIKLNGFEYRLLQ